MAASFQFENLGPQVTSQLAMRGVFGTEQGRPVTYTVLAGTPAIFVAADVETGRTIHAAAVPDTGGAWGLAVATDGKVYFATYNRANLYQYDPVSRAIANLGDPAQLAGLPKTTQYFELTAGARGCVYGGGYPNGHVFEYDPARGFRSFGQIFPGTQYPRCVAYDEPGDALYVGGGGARAWLVRVDLTSGEKSANLLPQAYSDRFTYTYDMNLVEGKLLLRMDPTADFLVLDQATLQVLREGDLLQSRGVSPRSPAAPKVYFTSGCCLRRLDLESLTVEEVQVDGEAVDLGVNVAGFGFVQLSSPDFPGPTLVAWVGNHHGRFLKYNLLTGKLQVTHLDLPRSASTLHTLAKGPDSKIYVSAYVGGGMGILDPNETEAQCHSFSQAEGITSLGRTLYLGVYPGARIFAYDTAQPWKSTGSDRTVVQQFELKTEHEQDRPYAMLGVPELGKVFIGTVPDYGKRGGALTVYDPATGDYRVWRNIVAGHSVVSLAYTDGLIYGGTTYRGGLGAEDVVDDARLFAFDPVLGVKLWEQPLFAGAGGITCLLVGPDDRLWGWAMGRFFVFDTKARTVVHSELVFADAVNLGRDGHMQVSLADGHIYGTIAGRFFRIDRESRAVTVIRQEPSRRLAQDDRGRFYFVDGRTTDGSNLWRMAIGTVPG
jgi:outer membrane protein assembly factor BamB